MGRAIAEALARLESSPGGLDSGAVRLRLAKYGPNDAAAEKKLGIPTGQTTKDGQISLMTARCVGACSRAPVVLCAGEVAGEVTTEQMLEQLERWAVE